MSLEKRLSAKQEMTPKPGQGFNVVGLDDFEDPGDELYLIDNKPTREEAERAAAKYRARHPGERVYVYGPK